MMKTQSAKAKGRNLQKQVRELLIEHLGIDPEDIESRSMGAGGEDLILAKAARNLFPYSIECKNQEKVNVWSAYKQATENSKSYHHVCALYCYKTSIHANSVLKYVFIHKFPIM